jgi:glycosyltransferase involved in cell wall biosynthesis
MNERAPAVTVLMPVYNSEAYLEEAIASILGQTYTDFEFLIINDGSTDRSASMIESYADRRLRVIHKSKNQGLIATLNEGLAESRGRYIVRMDGDDISLPDRIARQVAYMEAHPDVGLCGTWFEDFGAGMPSRTIRYSESDTEIRIRHLYQTHVAHPTAIIRKSVLTKHNLQFDPDYVHGEDYHFWVCMSRFCKISNIREVLVRKRDHPGNVSNRFAEIQRATCNRVKRLQFEWMGLKLTPEEAEIYSRFANTEWNFQKNEFERLANMLNHIHQANQKSGFIERDAYSHYLAGKWFHLCLNNPDLGLNRLRIYNKLACRDLYTPSLKSRFSMMIKTVTG